MQGSSIPVNPVPEVYVLWHPACAFGETAARAIYQWLRPGHGQGPHVFYRSLAAPEAPPGGLPPPLPGETNHPAPTHTRSTNLQLVIALIDENMIADASWRYWLSSLGTRTTSIARRIVPVAIDATAFNAPSPIREINFLRPAGANDETRIRSLLKQLTEALCRILRSKPRSSSNNEPDHDAVPKVKIFLSHAKKDGATPAKRIRDYIYSQTQISAFYDENDIPFGSAFARVLNSDVQSNETVALVAVRSAQYAYRPWCRRELSLFRRPRKEASENRWTLNPVLVVDALENGASTVSIPELGNSPVVRWSPEVPEQEEQIVTTLLRDGLLGAFHSAAGRKIPADDLNVVINFLPDPTSLLRIVQDNTGRALTIHYPGRGLSGLELDILDDLFPSVELRSFEGL
jgi:hypothetical protein